MPYYFSPFRKEYRNNLHVRKAKNQEYPSLFCDPDIIAKQGIRDTQGVLIENDHYYWIVNWFPRCEGHTMIVPKRYVTSHSQEGMEEVWARQELMVYAMDIMKQAFDTDGIEVFNQSGKESWSSIDHLHWHLVPSRKNDPLWQGQLQHMEKLGYYYTEEADEQKVVMFPIEIQYAQEALQELLADTIGIWKK